MRVVGIELVTFLFGQFDDFRSQFAGQFAGFAENHSPHGRIHTCEVFLSHRAAEQVHQSGVLDVLAEWCNQTRRAEHRPYTLYFVKQLYEQFVLAQFGFAFLFEVGVDGGMYAFQVSHERTHHSSGQATAYQQRCHQGVLRVNPVTQEVVDERLCQRAGFHVRFHVDVLD